MIMKKIYARVFALYAILVFIITMIPTLLWLYACKLFCSDNNFSIYLQSTFQVWMGIFMPMICCPVKHVGRQYFEKGKQYIVVVNHSSLLDIPVSSPGIPDANKTLGKISFAKTPLFGFIYQAGSILVDRSSAKSRADSYQKMLDCLHSGLHLCLYPEGTRNKSKEPLQKFHDGAFKVAIGAQVPIIPAIITGTKEAMPANETFYLLPHNITFEFLAPVSTIGLTEKDVQSLKQKVWDIMFEKLNS